MTELLAALFEAIFGIIAAFFRLLPVLLELIAILLIGAFTVVAYTFSAAFRRRRQEKWGGAHWRKYLELGGGAFCLVCLVSAGIWISARENAPRKNEGVFEVSKPEKDEDVRFSLRSGESNRTSFAVKSGGLSNIFNTRNLSDLSNSVRRNVIITPDESSPTNLGAR